MAGGSIKEEEEEVVYNLYMQERTGSTMCQVYGPVHLLRLLTKLGPILTASDMDQYVSSDLLFPYFQWSRSGTTGSTCFWASRIRILLSYII